MSKMDTGLTDGYVEIVLDGEKVQLVPTIEAAIAIDMAFDGFAEAATRMTRSRLNDTAMVVNYGLGRDARDIDKTREQVWKAGVTTIAPLAIRYVTILANGGKMPEDEGKRRGNEEKKQAA